MKKKHDNMKPIFYKANYTGRTVVRKSKYAIDATSISSIIKTICLKVLEKHFNHGIEEEDVITLSSGLIKLSITTFSISLLCDDMEKVREYISFMNSNPSDAELVEYIKNLEPYLDKDKYILNTTKLLYDMMNHAFELDFDELDLEKIDKELAITINSNSLGNDFNEKLTMYELLTLYRSINPNIDITIPDYELFFEYAKIGFSDSKEVFENKKLKKYKHYEIFDKITKILNSSPSLNGMKSIIHNISSQEIIDLFKNEDIGKHIIRCISFLDFYLNNLESLYDNDSKIYMKDLIKFLDTPKILSNEKIIPDIIKAIRKYSYYMDIDKLINLIIKVLEKKLEENYLNPDEIKPIITKLIKLKKNNDEKKDYLNIIDRFIGKEFISQHEINNVKQKILTEKINVDSIDDKIFNLLKLTKSEIELIMNYNINNYIWASKVLGLSTNSIIARYNTNCNFAISELIIELYRLNRLKDDDLIQLYNSKKIDINFFYKYYNEISFTKNISITNIFKEYYNQKNSFKPSEITKIKIDIIAEVYKENNIKTEENLEESSQEFIDQCLEHIDNESDLLFFYTKHLISLEIVADWCGENVIKKLFNEKEISLNDIEKLYQSKKVSKLFIEQMILSTNPNDDDLITYMYKNCFTEDTIIKLFLTRNIYSKEALNLKRHNIISKQTYLVIKNRDIKEMEARIGRSLEGMTEIEEIEIPKIKGNTIPLPKVENKKELKTVDNDKYNPSSTKSQKTLINPLIRIEYLKLLKCKEPEYINYDDEKNPFYHYNFYVIQDDYLGKNITNDAIIIAERIFTNRDNKKEFATENATYVMKYEDYLTLQGKQKELQLSNKKASIQEVPGAIYSINHRSGSWAMNLLKAIAKTKSGSSMEELTPNNQRYEIINWLHTIYTDDELSEISELIEEIDDYELHTYRPDRFGMYRSINQDNIKTYIKK